MSQRSRFINSDRPSNLTQRSEFLTQGISETSLNSYNGYSRDTNRRQLQQNKNQQYQQNNTAYQHQHQEPARSKQMKRGTIFASMSLTEPGTEDEEVEFHEEVEKVQEKKVQERETKQGDINLPIKPNMIKRQSTIMSITQENSDVKKKTSMKIKKFLCCSKEKNPYFEEVLIKERGTKQSLRLKQHYKGWPDRNIFYDAVYALNTLKIQVLLGIITSGTLLTCVVISLLYMFGNCVTNNTNFLKLMLTTFLQITGGTAAGMTMGKDGDDGYCNSILALNTLLNVGLKSVAFAVLVGKLQKVSPRMYFTPFCVINFRDKKPVLMMRVMNSQGSTVNGCYWVVVLFDFFCTNIYFEIYFNYFVCLFASR
jgi:hypothetical protein